LSDPEKATWEEGRTSATYATSTQK
jgi:hypothetical protein